MSYGIVPDKLHTDYLQKWVGICSGIANLLYVIANMGRNLALNCKAWSGSALELPNPIFRYNSKLSDTYPKGYGVLTTWVAAIPKKERISAGDGLRKLSKTTTQLYTN
jgi:hypothetical protein